MPSRGKKRSKSNQQSTTHIAGGQADSSSPTATGLQSGSMSRAAMDEAASRRAEKRKARAAERAKELEDLKEAGNKLFTAGDYLGAVKVYKAIVDDFGQKPVLMSNLAAAYLKLEEYVGAEVAASTALKYDPRMIKARYRRGLARKGMGQYKAALVDFRTVLEQDPTKNEAREQLKITEALYLELGDDDYDYEDDSGSSDDGWPHPDDRPEPESEAESDSSDCRHSGNGFPCRFYNHEGCAKKDSCRYSHAPDEKSERDRLGRNVCIFFLLGTCKFGAAKCVYSHDKSYLPHGWWDHDDLVAKLKEICSESELENHGKHAFSEFISVLSVNTPCLKCQSAGESVAHSGFAQVVEQAQPEQGSPPARKQTSVASQSSSERFVLLMALDGDPEQVDYKRPTLVALRAKIPVKTAASASEAFTYLAFPNLAGVFIADAALSKRKNSQVLSKVVEYARGGGSVALGGDFSSFVRPPDMATFFANSWGVNWKSGSYHRATFSLNTSHELSKSNSTLPSSYSMKALHAQGIAPSAAIYKEPGANPTESPAVQIRLGRGYMGYIGDVNWEEGSISLLLAMLQLSGTPSPVPAIPPDIAGKVTPKTDPTSPGVVKSGQANGTGPTLPTWMQPQASATSVSSSQLFVLLLALEGEMVEGYKQPTISAIKSKTPVKTALSTADALTHLSSPGLGGVFVTDAGIIKRQHSQVVTNLVEYAKAGGSVIIGGSFSSFIKPRDMTTFFKTSWGVNWEPGSYHRTKFFLNPAHDLAKTNPSLPPSYSMKALHVKDTPPDLMVYRPTQESRLESVVFSDKPVTIFNESPAIRTRIGKGFLGYVGDVNWEEGSSKLVLAMLGLLDPQHVSQPPPNLSTDTPKAATPAAKKATQAPSAAALTKPVVMLLSLNNEDFFATSHAHCLSALRDKVETFQALTAASALSKLESTHLAGVFITDAGIVKADNAHVLSRLVDYVKSGGNVVVGGLFSTFVSAEDMNAFLEKAWGLPWKAASYHRTEFSLNPAHEIVKKHAFLAASYSMKALHVGLISSADVVYLPSEDLRLPSSITDYSESPVVQRRIGRGSFGYIGDVNPEPETTNVVLAMLGLLHPLSAMEKGESVGGAKPETPVSPPLSRIDVQKAPKAAIGPTSRPFMMVLSFGNEKLFAGVQGDLLELLRSKLEVLHGLSNERVIELIGSPDLVGILVTDAGVADDNNAYLLGKLVAFAKAGGMVVMGGFFGSTMKFDDIRGFFQNSWGVSWHGGDYTSSDVTVNVKHELVKKNLNLPSTLRMKALHISGVTLETAVYHPAEASQAAVPAKDMQAPVALARVGKGHLGYIGDVGLQDEHSKIVLAMFGLT
ncbi:hypothetical protein LshimejAT787_0211490 [Lyophyllum shimeji]|uniref:C3H1-type domain-containing protein n=1 Tax=Lyophyllum shimeji TaxID=47721 RepID=A0A9P3PHI2_LYOSH|nr:hypothetical protein LshimejAT787_0211490 [Lyophyllum shimeji]